MGILRQSRTFDTIAFWHQPLNGAAIFRLLLGKYEEIKIASKVNFIYKWYIFIWQVHKPVNKTICVCIKNDLAVQLYLSAFPFDIEKLMWTWLYQFLGSIIYLYFFLFVQVWMAIKQEITSCNWFNMTVEHYSYALYKCYGHWILFDSHVCLRQSRFDTKHLL